jgi:hypothetical protein
MACRHAIQKKLQYNVRSRTVEPRFWFSGEPFGASRSAKLIYGERIVGLKTLPKNLQQLLPLAF